MPRRLLQHLAMASCVLALSACASTGKKVAEHQSADDLAQKSSALADRFQTDLQAQLMAAMQQGGAVGAIEVCHSVAPAIAAALSEESGAQVRRIALKQRNPAALAGGEMHDRLEALARSPLGPDGKPRSMQWISGTGKAARANYLRAIPMKAQPCAACHGTSIAPEVQARIHSLYPGDQAIGFQPGELRGAISVSWPIRGRSGGRKCCNRPGRHTP
jgi:hypothetical protein